MKAPQPAGSPIDANRYAGWISGFSGYRHTVTEQKLERWLAQFKADHLDLAARVLDCVEFIPYEGVGSAFKAILTGLPGWNKKESLRSGKWRFVPFSVSAGESGDTMLHQFRIANGLDGSTHGKMFVHVRDLLGERLGPDDTVVFVDDFAGTGNQVCDAWGNDIAELLPEGPRTYLVLVAASQKAREIISEKTGLTVAPSFELTESDNIFSNACTHFGLPDKEALLEFCNRADRKFPKGYGDCGFVIVFAHRCPNNSISILHMNHPKWEALFRRHDQ